MGEKTAKKIKMKISNQARPQEKSFRLMFESHFHKMGGLEFRPWETEDKGEGEGDNST